MFTDDVDYVRVGCYKDEMPYRALPEILANYRRVKNAKSPDVLDWNDLENSVIKRCAVKVCYVDLVSSSVLYGFLNLKWNSFFLHTNPDDFAVTQRPSGRLNYNTHTTEQRSHVYT